MRSWRRMQQPAAHKLHCNFEHRLHTKNTSLFTRFVPLDDFFGAFSLYLYFFFYWQFFIRCRSPPACKSSRTAGCVLTCGASCMRPCNIAFLVQQTVPRWKLNFDRVFNPYILERLTLKCDDQLWESNRSISRKFGRLLHVTINFASFGYNQSSISYKFLFYFCVYKYLNIIHNLYNIRYRTRFF